MAEIPFDDEGHLLEVLDFLGDELEPSILIGGWATVRRVGGEISRDIDLIIASDAVRQKIEATLSELSRSTHLQGTKWRGTFDGVHVDVYLPHQSQLGGVLRLRVEELAKHTERLEGSRWQLLTIEAHTISKFAALLDRPDTEKGFKDAREIVRLLEARVTRRWRAVFSPLPLREVETTYRSMSPPSSTSSDPARNRRSRNRSSCNRRDASG